MSDVDIMSVTADDADVADIAHLIAAAFNPLDVAAWLVADPEVRLQAMRGQFLIIAAHALEHGNIDMSSDGHGVAVWFDRTRPIPEPPQYSRRLRRACGHHTPRFETLDEAFEQHHPETAHHHLAFLAVRSDFQGRGIGSALLEHHHDDLDADGIAGYLEASSQANRSLYARHGYAESGPVITLPEGPSLWPMWRQPQRD